MDIFNLTLVSLCSAVHNSEVKRASQSDIICRMSPFLQYHSSKSTTVTLAAVAVKCIGASHILACRRSVMVSMVSFPPSSRSGPTKSKATDSKCASGTVMDLWVWLFGFCCVGMGNTMGCRQT